MLHRRKQPRPLNLIAIHSLSDHERARRFGALREKCRTRFPDTLGDSYSSLRAVRRVWLQTAKREQYVVRCVMRLEI